MPDTDTVTFDAAWQQWHRERESYFADPLGWVSLTGLYWLTDEFDTVSDLPGRWRADADDHFRTADHGHIHAGQRYDAGGIDAVDPDDRVHRRPEWSGDDACSAPAAECVYILRRL